MTMAKLTCTPKGKTISCKESDGDVFTDDSLNIHGVDIRSDPRNQNVLVAIPDTDDKWTCMPNRNIMECYRDGGGYAKGTQLTFLLNLVPLE